MIFGLYHKLEYYGLNEVDQNGSKPLFAQILELLPSLILENAAKEHKADHYSKSYAPKIQ